MTVVRRALRAQPAPTIPPPVEANTPKPLGHYLKSLGFLTGPQLAQVLTQQAQRSAARTPISLGALLIAKGTMTPQDLVMALMIQQLDRVQAAAVPPPAAPAATADLPQEVWGRRARPSPRRSRSTARTGYRSASSRCPSSQMTEDEILQVAGSLEPVKP